jgi:hypothetical protein
MKRSRRIFSALLLIAALLSSQIAVAAYACPMMLVAAVTSSESTENGGSGGANSDLMPCERTDGSITNTNDGALCRAHCDEGHANVGDAFAQLPIAFVAAFSVAIPPLTEIQNARSVYAGLGLHHALGPPLAITHCCLRI